MYYQAQQAHDQGHAGFGMYQPHPQAHFHAMPAHPLAQQQQQQSYPHTQSFTANSGGGRGGRNLGGAAHNKGEGTGGNSTAPSTAGGGGSGLQHFPTQILPHVVITSSNFFDHLESEGKKEIAEEKEDELEDANTSTSSMKKASAAAATAIALSTCTQTISDEDATTLAEHYPILRQVLKIPPPLENKHGDLIQRLIERKVESFTVIPFGTSSASVEDEDGSVAGSSSQANDIPTPSFDPFTSMSIPKGRRCLVTQNVPTGLVVTDLVPLVNKVFRAAAAAGSGETSKQTPQAESSTGAEASTTTPDAVANLKSSAHVPTSLALLGDEIGLGRTGRPRHVSTWFEILKMPEWAAKRLEAAFVLMDSRQCIVVPATAETEDVCVQLKEALEKYRKRLPSNNYSGIRGSATDKGGATGNNNATNSTLASEEEFLKSISHTPLGAQIRNIIQEHERKNPQNSANHPLIGPLTVVKYLLDIGSLSEAERHERYRGVPTNLVKSWTLRQGYRTPQDDLSEMLLQQQKEQGGGGLSQSVGLSDQGGRGGRGSSRGGLASAGRGSRGGGSVDRGNRRGGGRGGGQGNYYSDPNTNNLSTNGSFHATGPSEHLFSPPQFQGYQHPYPSAPSFHNPSQDPHTNTTIYYHQQPSNPSQGSQPPMGQGSAQYHYSNGVPPPQPQSTNIVYVTTTSAPPSLDNTNLQPSANGATGAGGMQRTASSSFLFSGPAELQQRVSNSLGGLLVPPSNAMGGNSPHGDIGSGRPTPLHQQPPPPQLSVSNPANVNSPLVYSNTNTAGSTFANPNNSTANTHSTAGSMINSVRSTYSGSGAGSSNASSGHAMAQQQHAHHLVTGHPLFQQQQQQTTIHQHQHPLAGMGHLAQGGNNQTTLVTHIHHPPQHMPPSMGSPQGTTDVVLVVTAPPPGSSHSSSSHQHPQHQQMHLHPMQMGSYEHPLLGGQQQQHLHLPNAYDGRNSRGSSFSVSGGNTSGTGGASLRQAGNSMSNNVNYSRSPTLSTTSMSADGASAIATSPAHMMNNYGAGQQSYQYVHQPQQDLLGQAANTPTTTTTQYYIVNATSAPSPQPPQHHLQQQQHPLMYHQQASQQPPQHW